MNKFVVVGLFLVCYNVSAITYEQMAACMKVNCTAQVNECNSDQTCNTAATCVFDCPPGNVTCYKGCSAPASSDATFWAWDVCCVDCMSIVAAYSGEPVKECGVEQGDQCYSAYNTCRADVNCAAAVKCVQDCGYEQYNCQGDCVLQNFNQSGHFSNFVELFDCLGSCLSSFITGF